MTDAAQMMRLGSLFSGAGGLDLAVEAVFGARTVWHCENDAAASKVLAYRWPGVPNLNDVTAADWSSVEPVEIVCGGYPCQPFSAAGRRKGTTDERHLWPYFAEAIRVLRPRLVVLENVAGHRSMGFDRVLADLAGLRYDAQWCSLRASDVGAPHRRERIFVIAHAKCPGQQRWQTTEPRSVGCGRASSQSDGYSPLTPDAASDGWHEGWPESARLLGGSDAALSSAGPLLPTPAVNDIGEGKTVEWWDEWTTKSKAKHGNGNGHGNSLAIEAQRMSGVGPVGLLPTPTGRDGKGANQRGDDICLTGALLATPSSADGGGGHLNRSGSRKGELLLPGQAREMATSWGKYEAAIRRWETLTRPAPSPTELNTKGNPRLAAAFSEWMMGWPDGWVTDVPGISRNDALRIIGNGVVPQQAIAALRLLLHLCEEVA